MEAPIYKHKMLDEAEQMVQDMAQEVRSDFKGKIGMATGVVPAQQKQQDISGSEAETIFLKADVAAACPVPVRMPPGYSSAALAGRPLNQHEGRLRGLQR